MLQLEKNGTTVLLFWKWPNADFRHGCKTAWQKRA